MVDRGFSYQDMLNLSNILNQNKEEDDSSDQQFYSGKTESTLHPGNVMTGDGKKQTAQPYAKIEAKVNNRLPANKDTQIWTDNDFKEQNIKEDGRPKPKFEILYKQTVNTGDVYLGMSGKSNSSLSCDHLLVKIWLPNTSLKEIGLEVKEQSLHIQSPNYLLNHILQYKVDKDNSEAKWDKEKGLLLVTLKIIKADLIDQFMERANEDN